MLGTVGRIEKEKTCDFFEITGLFFLDLNIAQTIYNV